jgi:hypothetical protein
VDKKFIALGAKTKYRVNSTGPNGRNIQGGFRDAGRDNK